MTALMVLPVLAFAAPPASAATGLWGPGILVPGVAGVDGDDMQNKLDIAADPMGNVFTAFDAWNGTGYTIILNRFVPGVGWAGGFQFGMPEWSYNPSIATDSHGNAFVGFTYYNLSQSKYVIACAFFSPMAGWGGFKEFGYNASYQSSSAPAVAMDDQGVGYIAFAAWNGSAYELWGTWASMDGSNGTQELLAGQGSIATPLSRYAGVDGDPAGGAMVVFSSRTTGSFEVRAARLDTASGWGPIDTIGTGTGDRLYATVGFDAGGHALATWARPAAAIYSAGWDRGAGWAPVETVVASGANYYPSVAVAPSGVAVVAFMRWSGSYYAPAAARYSPGTGWTAVSLLPEAMQTGIFPEVAVDNSGGAVVAYRSNALGVIRGAEYTSSGWGQPASVLGSTGGPMVDPVVASMGHGRAMVALRAFTGSTYDGFVTTYSAPDDAAPWITIDAPFDGASFGGGSAQVTGWAEPGAQVTVNGARAVTFPDGRFEVSVPLGEGVNVLRARAVDAAGNEGLSNTRTVTQTGPGPLLDAERRQAGLSGWLDVQHIDNLSLGSGWWSRVHSDAQGNAWATWYEPAAGRLHFYANRYTRGVGWGAPEQLRAFNDGTLYDTPQGSVTPQGNALFVWSQWNTSNMNLTVWGRLWMASGGWQDAVQLDNASQYAYQLDTAASPDGQLGVTWRQNQGMFATIHARLWNASTGWGPAEQLTPDGNVSHVPSIAFAADGTALVTTAFRSGPTDNLVLYTRAPGGAWSSGSQLTMESTYIQTPYILEAGAGGNFTVSWVQTNGSVGDWRAGRMVNGSFSQQTVFVNAWNWWPEVAVDAEGYSYIALTESATGVANARVAVAPPGQPFGAPVLLDNGTLHGGGPNLVVHADGTNVTVLWDEVEDGLSRANARTYGKSTGTWGPLQRISPDYMRAHIPHAAPMPDGGLLVVWQRNDFDLGGYQVDSRRFVPPETVAPSLVVTTPLDGFLSAVPSVRVSGAAEVGASVTINGVMAEVAANGSFAVDLALTNGSNAIQVVARDAAGNTAVVWRNGTFDDPDRRRIEQLEAENAALQAELDATNASLQAAIAAGDAALLQEINDLNASLLTQLASQNTALLGEIAALNATLLAELAAGDAALAQLIADTNATLLADLAALDAGLTQAIADTNATLLAELAAQNDALLATIAATNATLFAELAALDAALLQALADQNAALLAAMAAEDAALAQLIADTNMTLLAELAALDGSLRAELASTNDALLAALALQNDDLLQAIATTNASLLAELAAGDAALYARLTADDAALWDQLNATAAEQQASLQGTQGGLDQTNSSLSTTQDELGTTTQSAASANTMALLGILLGGVGLALGGMAFMMARRRPPMSESSGSPMPPPTPGGAEEVEADVVGNPGKARGSSMASESELGGSFENDR